MKKIVFICFALIYCACENPDTHADEIDILFAAIQHSGNEKNKDFHIDDHIMKVPNEFHFKDDEIIFLYEEGKFLKTKDMECFKTQIKIINDKNINYWSTLLSKTQQDLTNFQKISKYPLFSDDGKQNYATKKIDKDVIQFSYPLFNCNRQEAILLTYYFNKNLVKEYWDILFFKKNDLREWKYSGRGDLIINYKHNPFKDTD